MFKLRLSLIHSQNFRVNLNNLSLPSLESAAIGHTGARNSLLKNSATLSFLLLNVKKEIAFNITKIIIPR